MGSDLHESWGGPPGLRRACTPACSESWRTRAQSKTQRSLLGNRRVWRRPTAGVDAGPTWFSSLFVGRRPILTDLEVRPTTLRCISRHWEKYAALNSQTIP